MSAASPQGYDAWMDTDLQADGRSASGADLVANDMLQRVTVKALANALAPGGYSACGIDVREWVGGVTDQEMANARGPELVAVMNRDARLDPSRTTAQVQVTQTGDAYDLTIALGGYLKSGQRVALVLGVNAVTVDLLSRG
ncbi:MAG TPA: hypothetical protein VLT47_14215 [Anaeromyxobacteraceae bacterium]|nr:hypothetical protein [Anaeromyxobacteraceae bacterium]